jgi:predicted amidohydrolase
MSCRVGHEVAAPGIEFDSFGHSTIASPSGKVLASMTEGEGLAYAKIDIPAEDIQRWRGIATYRTDRRPNLYR